MTEHHGMSRRLAEYVVKARFEDLSEKAVVNAKRATLDTIAAMLAGSGVGATGAVIDLAASWGGAAEARVVGQGGQGGQPLRLPAPLAAWCNGVMARVLEIDDCVDDVPVHPSASAVPLLLALAEARAGTGGLAGRDFITALAVAQDLIIRLARATRVNAMVSGRYNLFKIFGPTAAAARVLGLDVEQTHHALGIAYASAQGEGQSALDGAFSLPLQQGNVAKAALIAALLAERGSTGCDDFLFGRMGFFNAFEPDPIVAPIGQGLGQVFLGEEISVKPYSACRACHSALQLIQQYRAEHGNGPIESITATVNSGIFGLVGAPIDGMADPYSPTAAQFSLPFSIAATLTRGDFFLDELTPEVIGDSAIRTLSRHVNVIADESMNTDMVLGRTRLEIVAAGRDPVVLETELPLGNPANPLSFEDCGEKLRKCAAFAARPPAEDAIDALIEVVGELDTADDVAPLTAGLG
ncbi:MAG TPA: MmgE/PrpD family protein [Alphaproteobacteria bacterium]|nr:MmgE/PrpD family protein [Alphaproteobacteria bacterium]